MPKAALTGAHAIIYSRDADRDRAFLRDVLQFPFVDAGHGWLIFALPPSEIAVHPADGDDRHELYLMTHDVAAFVEAMVVRGVDCTAPQSLGWGVLTSVTLPIGAKLGVYEPRHPQPKRTRTARKTRRRARHATAGPVKRSKR